MKAKSRLKLAEPAAPLSPTSPHRFRSLSALRTVSTSLASNPRVAWLMQRYQSKVAALALGVMSFLLLMWLMHRYTPTQVQDVVIANMFLPFQLVLFLTLFFISSFGLLSPRRGLLFAAAIQVLVFFRLQRIEVSPKIVIGVVSLFAIIELLFHISRRLRKHQHAALSQKTFTPKRSRHRQSLRHAP